MSRKFSEKLSKKSRKEVSDQPSASPLASLLAAGLSFPALAAAQSVPYPTYVTGPQPNGSWVVSTGQVITPAGTQVDLGIRVRAKAIALNPNAAHSHRRRPHHGYVGESMATEPSRCSTPTPALSCRTTSRSEGIRAAAITA